jgi:hypothetical protein
MAGLYRRGVERSAGLPLGQVQASKGAGGAIPRGFAPQQKQDNSAQTTENAKTLGGLLGMMNQQKAAQQEVQPALTEAQQTVGNINNLPNPAFGMQTGSAPSTDGNWGGVQASAFGSGLPVSTGEWGGAANGAVTNFGAGLELPGMGTAPAGAVTSFGGGIPGAAAGTAGQAASNLQLPDLNIGGLLNMIPSFGGGAGA